MAHLSVIDEAGIRGKVDDEVGESQGSEEVRECVHNGVMADGAGESGSELDGEEDVLYETSSHEAMESSSGSGDSERTWEERYKESARHRY